MQVADISVLSEKNKVVGCSFNQSFVGLWVVDLKDVRPFGLGRNSAADNPVHSAAAAAVARSEPSLPGSMSGRGEIPRGSSGGGVSASMAPLPPRRSAAVGSTALSPQRRVSNGEESVAAGRGSGGGGGVGGGGAEGRPYGRAMERGISSGLEPSSRQQPVMAAPSGVLTRLNSVGSAAAAGRYAAAGAGDSFDAPPEAMQRPASFPNSSRPGAAAAAAYAASAKPGGVGMVSVGVGVGDSLARGQVDPGQLYALAEQGAAAVGQRLEPSGGGVRPNRSSAGPREDVGLSRGDQLQQQQQPARRSDADVVADILGRHDQVGRRFLLPSPPSPPVTPLNSVPCLHDLGILLTHLTLHLGP